MQKKENIFAHILHVNKKRIENIYHKYLFLIIFLVIAVTAIFLFFNEVHYLMFGNVDNAIGQYIMFVATILGGMLVALGLWINNRRVGEQIRQNNIAEKSQINTRFKDAATLLGNDNVSTTLSGVYALHQIAMDVHARNDIENGYVRIIQDILCVFIRENTETIRNEKGKKWRVNKKPAILIETILKVLFSRKTIIYRNLISDLSYCVFENIYFEKAHFVGVDFSKTKFIKSTFKRSTFISCYFEETFIDEVDFSDCIFEKSVFDHSNIRKTKFTKASFVQSDFCEAVFTEVNFDGASFDQVDFGGANYNPTLKEEPASNI